MIEEVDVKELEFQSTDVSVSYNYGAYHKGDNDWREGDKLLVMPIIFIFKNNVLGDVRYDLKTVKSHHRRLEILIMIEKKCLELVTKHKKMQEGVDTANIR